MDACHILLGKPWQFDVDVVHRGKENNYTFFKDNVKVVLAPIVREGCPVTPPTKGGSFLVMPVIEEHVKESGEVYALVVREGVRR